MRYKHYPEYKDSGVAWLGEVPAHWEVKPLKMGYSVKLGKMLQPVQQAPQDVLKPYLRASNIQPDGISVSDIKEMWFSPLELGELRLKHGDLLVSEGGDVGRSAIWRRELEEAYYQNSINRVRGLEGNNNYYLNYLLSCIKESGAIDVICNRLSIAHLTTEKLNEIQILFPTADEQSAITAFLDHETARIDQLIAKQERLIELLKEKRQAVISHVVTKGLDPEVPMKDSGVEWLGEVPAHWVVSRVGFVSKLIQTGPFGSQLHAEDYVEGGVPVINPANIQAGAIVPDEQVSVDAETAERLHRHQLEENEIIFARRGELGRCALVTSNEKGWICGTGSLKIALDVGKVEPAFVTRFLGTPGVKEELSLSSKGSTMENLNAEILSRVSLVYPDIEEQQRILQYVGDTEEKFEHLLQRAGEAVILLKEHRTAIISAAVTGKIDVRDWRNPNHKAKVR